jgi:hypothetical protein
MGDMKMETTKIQRAMEMIGNCEGWTLKFYDVTKSYKADGKVDKVEKVARPEMETYNFEEIPGWSDQEITGLCGQLFAHGVKQKLMDTVANATELNLTPTDQISAINELWSAFREGNFNIKKNGQTTGKISKVDALKAIDEMEGISDSIKAMLKAKLGC